MGASRSARSARALAVGCCAVQREPLIAPSLPPSQSVVISIFTMIAGYIGLDMPAFWSGVNYMSPMKVRA